MADVFLTTKQKLLKTKWYIKINAEHLVGGGEGKWRNEFAEWHNYAGCNIRRMTQRNKFNLEECVCKSIYYIPHMYAIPQVIPHDMLQTHSSFYPHPVGESERTEWSLMSPLLVTMPANEKN